MSKVNFKKVVCGVSLGTVMVLGSMSSAFAADINHPTAQDKTVELQHQKSNPSPKPSPKPSPIPKPSPSPNPTPKPNPNQQQPRQQVKLLTQEQAKAIALKQFKGDVKDIQLTKENGKDVYVIVIHDQDGKDHTVKIDAVTGVIMNFTQEQVKDIALKQYKGTVKDTKLNNENGKDVYVIVIHDQDGKDHDVKIDAVTGETVNFTQDQVKDIALKQYKGTVKDIKLNNENGKDVYVIVIHGQDGKDHDVKIDAKTGEAC